METDMLSLCPHLCSRVCEVKLLGNHKFTIKQQKYKVSDEIKKGPAIELFGELSSFEEQKTSCLEGWWDGGRLGAAASCNRRGSWRRRTELVPVPMQPRKRSLLYIVLGSVAGLARSPVCSFCFGTAPGYPMAKFI